MATVAKPSTVTPSQKLTWQLVHAEPGAWVYSVPGVNPAPLVRGAGRGWVPEGTPAEHDELVKHSALHYAEYIGRVGVLAAALGVGAAVAGTPGIAWAEPTEPDTTTSTSSTESAEDASETASECSSDDAETPETTSEAETTSPSVAETTESAGSGTETSTGETAPGVESTTDPAVTPDAPADAAPSPTTPTGNGEPTAAPAVEAPGQTVTPPSTEPRHDSPPSTATGESAESTASISSTPVMEVPAPLEEHFSTSGADTTTASLPEAADAATTAAVSEVAPTAAEPETPASVSTVNRVLDTVLAPLTAPASPAAQAAQTPLQWGVFAWVRRAFFNSTPKLSYDPTTTSQVDNTITGKVTVIDRDGDTVTLSASTPINGGTVVVNPDGTFTYTVPTTLYTTGGTDTFTITATDLNSSGHIHGLRGLLNNITFGLVGSPGHTAATTLTLDIAAATAPIPATPAYTLGTTQPSTGAVPGEVHVTDPDLDLDSLTYTVTGGPVDGNVTLDAVTGAFTYTPTPTARHEASAESATPDQLADTFAVTVDDSRGGVLTVPVTVTIDPLNTPPSMTLVASDPDSLGTVHITITVTDPDTDPVTYLVIHDPAYGTLTPTPGGYDYTPTAEARLAAAATPGIVTETFQLQASDAHHGTDTETATVTISPANGEVTRTIADSTAGLTATAAPTGAVTVTMAGTFGAHPKYETITAPWGGTLAGRELGFNTFPSQSGINSAYRAQGEWLESVKGVSLGPGETPVLVTYSLSTHAVVGRLRTDPESLRGIRIIMLGAPETPGNPNDGNGYQNTEGLPTTGDLSNVTMVVVQYDPVADAAVSPNYWTRRNARMATHTYGYNGLDLTAPDAVHVDPVTGATVLYFRSEVLPMLEWLDPWVSDEKMAELDAKYRPLIEAGYRRPDGIFSPAWEAAQANIATVDA
ncbi:Ig-like domain-containing protein [Mycolicibacterium pyrenivorans]|uniref:Ig-like domain-containing protein n=1 Tax=Mycolicibacterium pyrenivorans TaxID=187102 RepID=UPI0021F3BBD9|nr:VCBS domain-containing protein [Mycolicibacterium pyrenivorans]MCV7151621.1 hypothetical protein [Mycolicibacterium pyrenivorans]